MKKLIPILVILGVCAATSGAVASTFPEKPVKIVIAYSAGGTSDIIGRLLQTPASAAAGQPFVVENKAGGASVIGTSSVARAAPDGHTILLADLALIVNPGLIKDLPYNTTKDFRAVTAVAKAPLVLLVNASVPANSLADLMALAKKKPRSLNFGSGGYGSSTHMAGEMFLKSTKLDLVHVPFQGVAPAMNALLGGQVEIYFGGTSTALPYLASKRLKALAITGNKRSPLLPNVPTFQESGVGGMNADTYWGFYVPSGTDDAKVQALNKILRKSMSDPTFVARTGELGLELIGNTPEEQQTQFLSMVKYWSEFIKETGIQIH